MSARGLWLAPAGALFGALAATRAALYARGALPRRHLRGPVISVGNLSVGGSGKTPLVAHLARRLRAAGLPVAILSRGYRGRHAGAALIVSDGERVAADAAQAGDEPVMLARELPGVVVAVGPRRDRVGSAVEERFGPRVHLLDDGFQHLRLARELDIVCVHPDDLRDRPLPAGRLRERPGALRRADLVLLTGDGEADPAALGGRPLLRYRRRVVGFRDSRGEQVEPPRSARLITGIARPERVATDVESAGVRVTGHDRFRDHHAFSDAELRGAAERARCDGAAALVTTAKDRTRIGRPPADPPLLVVEIAPEIDGEAQLEARLLEVAGRVR